MRQPWPDEEERNRVLQEKHQRGSVARKSRAVRIHEKEIEKMMRSNRIKANKSKEQQNMSGKSSQEDLPQQMVKSMNIVHQRTDETKCLLSLQSGEPGNTRQQRIYSKATPTQHNEVLAQKGAAKTFKPELIDHPIPSIQHGGLQQQIFPKPTHTQQSLKDSQQGPSYQHQDEVLPQERAMRTSQKEFIDHQAPSQHNGGSENTRQYQISSKPTPSQQKFKHPQHAPTVLVPTSSQHQISSKPTPSQQKFKYPQQAPKHQNHNEVLPRDDVKRSHRGELFDHQNNSYRATEYVEPAYQARGKFTQHANAYGASNYHQNAWADHQGHQPLRSRNRDFNSRDKFYGQDYHQQDYQFYGQDYHHHVQYRSQQNQQQSHYDGRQTTRQYHTQQKHYQNYNYSSRSNQKQYHNQQNQPQRFPVQRPQLQPCDFYYRNGWCGFGENCRYSHDL
uniref:C3H1-type domain-containing protein n=1 Tax=Arundo donax TaxID=35708 RepID=A0A0A9G5W3_ARUDO